MDKYITRNNAISAVCLGCNQQFSDEPCEPSDCTIRRSIMASPAADVVPRSEADKLEYTLLGVMHCVDKWLDGDELEQDEVNRAITMRENTLRIVENLQAEVERLNGELIVESTRRQNAVIAYHSAKQEVAREIFEEIEAEVTEALKCNYKRRTEYYTQERFKKEDGDFINTVNGKIDALRGIEGFIAELKKKYTEGRND